MRDYQRKNGNKYYLPRSVYHRTLWAIRDYERMKEEADSLIEISSTENDGMPRGSGLSDKVSMAAVKRSDLLRDISVIDKALFSIPREYREGVWYNIQYNRPFPCYASRSTYAKHKSRFINDVAVGLNFV